MICAKRSPWGPRKRTGANSWTGPKRCEGTATERPAETIQGMKPFLVAPRAEQDVSDIWDYIAGDCFACCTLPTTCRAVLGLTDEVE